MHIVRYSTADDPRTRVGVLDEGSVQKLAVGSVAELLRLSLEEFRAACARPVGGALDARSVRLRRPIDGFTEVWAAGVTYQTSQYERMRESSSDAGVYERVYTARRPEIFFKSTAWRVAGDGDPVAIRADSTIDVPEPELALVVNRAGEVVGYTVCNDVSSRSIEGENPLYLPQAKNYLGSCALGFGIRPAWEVADPRALGIGLEIVRGGATVWLGEASTSQLNRTFDELVGWLYVANVFPDGSVLSTGTCLVPELPFTLEDGDITRVTVEEVGSISNPVVRGTAAMGWLVEEFLAPS